MKKYLLESQLETERLNFQNQIDVYDLKKELEFLQITCGEKVLDAGCGNGNVIEELKPIKGVLIHGVDISKDRAARASERFKDHHHIQIFQRSLENTNLRKNFYDKIICRYIFEHVPDPLAVLKELRSLLAEKGEIYIINFDEIFFNFYTKSEKLNQDLKELQSKLPNDYEIGRKLPQMLKSAGFENVEWRAETYFFQGERLELEQENSRMRFLQLKDNLVQFFSSESEFDDLASSYLKEMSDPNNVLQVTKFIIRAS